MTRSWWEHVRRRLALDGPVATLAASRWDVSQGHGCTVYCGAFAVYGRRGQLLWQVRGRVVEWPDRPTDVYLWNPPPSFSQHAKGPCLQLVKPGSLWFRLHWERPAHDFDASRAYVEHLLGESMRSAN